MFLPTRHRYIDGFNTNLFRARRIRVSKIDCEYPVDLFNRQEYMIRRIVKVLLDLSSFALAILVSYALRFNPTEAIAALQSLGWLIAVFILVRLGCFFLFRLYSSIWRYSGTFDLLNILKAASLGTLINILLTYFMHLQGMSRLIIVLEWLLVVFLTGGLRLSVRLVYEMRDRFVKRSQSHQDTGSNGRTNVLIYGAGRAGELLLRDINSSAHEGLNVVGLIDDDKKKWGQYIHNRRILGGASIIPEVIQEHNVEQIFFAIASLSGGEARNLLSTIRQAAGNRIEIKIIPGLQDLVQGRIRVGELRRIEIADLLRRKPVELDYTPVRNLIEDQVSMVVGGGGSIGSELCRQIAFFKPKKLVILDASEFNLYDTEMNMREQFPELSLDCVVGNATNRAFLDHTFQQYQPGIVFHAAAYKHVPLMEFNPWAAVYNNIKATLLLTELAGKHQVSRFVMISTDKAVHPSSMMGATKRICEEVVLAGSQHYSGDYMTVRFGNVLGSSGSVIPRFQKQIDAGGPITVTHPEIKRYFMLISEAVELVLQAGAIGENGVCYVLDMGQPLSILELAQYMIRLSGLREDEDIQIEFTGLRPGEKLTEELYMVGEEVGTKIPGLMMLRQNNIKDDSYMQELTEFVHNTYSFDENQLRKKVQQFVPEYTPNLTAISR